jgi:choline dehydrogenase
MLSGIGPAETLKSHGIPVMLENEEVGSNMKDHLCTTPIIVKVKDGLTLDYLANEIKALPALARWYLTSGGPLASNAGEAAAFIRSTDDHFPQTVNALKDFSSGPKSEDLEIIGAPLAFIHRGEERPIDNASVLSLAPIGICPQSHGTVTIKSRDVFDVRRLSPRLDIILSKSKIN